jgi:hypothetical protein
MITMRSLTDTLAMMVTDTKGRVEFATTQLAKMVGYNVKAMTEGMNMAGLLPPPYSQLHPSYMKVCCLMFNIFSICRLYMIHQVCMSCLIYEFWHSIGG